MTNCFAEIFKPKRYCLPFINSTFMKISSSSYGKWTEKHSPLPIATTRKETAIWLLNAQESYTKFKKWLSQTIDTFGYPTRWSLRSLSGLPSSSRICRQKRRYEVDPRRAPKCSLLRFLCFGFLRMWTIRHLHFGKFSLSRNYRQCIKLQEVRSSLWPMSYPVYVCILLFGSRCQFFAPLFCGLLDLLAAIIQRRCFLSSTYLL
jgi:hypothetical protein